MGEKNYVGMGYTVCPYCGKENEEACILIDRHMRSTLEQRNFAGMELCDEHKKLAEEHNAVCLFAMDEVDGVMKLHGFSVLMSLNTFTKMFQEAIKKEARIPKIGNCVQVHPKMMDALIAAARDAGQAHESQVDTDNA